MMMNLRPYNKERYSRYLVSIAKKVSCTVILSDYLSIKNKLEKELPHGVSVEFARFENQRYFIFLYSNQSNIKKLHDTLEYLEDRYKDEFPWLCKDAGFIVGDKKEMYLVLKYYIKAQRSL